MSRPVPTPRRPRRRGLMVAALLLLAGGTAFTVWDDNRRQKQAEFRPLPSTLAAEAAVGWVVAQPPDHPGPYSKGKYQPQLVERGKLFSASYRGTNGMVRLNLPVKDDSDRLVVPLQTPDGAMTIAVLERSK